MAMLARANVPEPLVAQMMGDNAARQFDIDLVARADARPENDAQVLN